MSEKSTDTGASDERFPLGAHIVTQRRWYVHHGIYIGGGQVVHYAGLSSSLRRSPVARASLDEFRRGCPVHLHHDAQQPYPEVEVVARALSRLGEDAYDLLHNNCEHFCSWCLFGTARSAQAERLLCAGGLLALAVETLSAWIRAVSRHRPRNGRQLEQRYPAATERFTLSAHPRQRAQPSLIV